MNELIIKLKQHTPLIHFQHDQDNATLRASEVKPRLDDFIIRNEFKNNYDSCQHLFPKMITKEVFDTGVRPLDYKMKIICREPNSSVFDIPEKFPCYFGGMGEEVQSKRFVYHNGIIEIQIVSMNEEVINILKKMIGRFFMWSNFGTRQSKGFGSFYLHKDDPLYLKVDLSYSFFVAGIETSNQVDKYKKTFNYIDLFYRSLRSGINKVNRNGGTDFYFKSMMFMYANKKGWQWDKRTIKEEVFKIAKIDSVKKEKYLMKDLMGISSQEMWRTPYSRIDKDHKSEDPQSKIDRMKSPIHFKPIYDGKNWRVFFDADIVNEQFFDQIFEVKSINGSKTTIKTLPKAIGFDFYDFFKYAFKHTSFNFGEHIDENFRHNSIPEYRILREVYSELQDYDYE